MISSDGLSSGTLFRTSDWSNGMGNATFHVQTTHHSLHLLFKFLRKKKTQTQNHYKRNRFENFDVTA